MIGKIEDFLNDNPKKVFFSLMPAPFIIALIKWGALAISAHGWPV